MIIELVDVYPFTLLALCVWREARGELLETKQAVAWSIKNRVLRPMWWGHSWETCILKPFQYSSFNHDDPNAVKLPKSDDQSWQDSLTVASQVYPNPPVIPDSTGGADSYFDISLDNNPPGWSKDPTKIVKTCDVGRIHFYKTL